jgi:hypothetical protein
VDFTTDLLTYLHQLSVNAGLGSDILDDTLLTHTANLRAAVPSYLGLQLTIIENACSVIMTAIRSDQTATTSLRLPLAALGPHFDPKGRVTLYAATPGAFLDLAADLGYVLHLPDGTRRATDPTDGNSNLGDAQGDGDQRITLDADLPPSTLLSGVTGLAELPTKRRVPDGIPHLDVGVEITVVLRKRWPLPLQ